MPLGPEYDKQIDCDVADMKNISGGRAGGSITAAQFLQRFIQDGTPWAHLDIAGVAWTTKDKAIVPKGGSGFGVRLLDRSEEHTSELQSLMRTSYAVFCLKKNNKQTQ